MPAHRASRIDPGHRAPGRLSRVLMVLSASAAVPPPPATAPFSRPSFPYNAQPRAVAVPAVVLDGHVDAAVDEESHRLVAVLRKTRWCRMLAGSWEFQLVLMSAPCARRKSATSKWRLMTANASATSSTCCTERGFHWRSTPRARVVVGIMLVGIAQCRRAGLVEPVLHARQVAHARRVRQIVRQWPDAGEQWDEVCVRVRECELDGLRRGRWLAPQYRGIEIEKRGDESPAAVERCAADEPILKVHPGVTRAATAHAATR